MLREVEQQFHSCRRHSRTTGTEETRLQAGAQRLACAAIVFGGREFLPQGAHEIGCKQVAARLASHDHELAGDHSKSADCPRSAEKSPTPRRAPSWPIRR